MRTFGKGLSGAFWEGHGHLEHTQKNIISTIFDIEVPI